MAGRPKALKTTLGGDSREVLLALQREAVGRLENTTNSRDAAPLISVCLKLQDRLDAMDAGRPAADDAVENELARIRAVREEQARAREQARAARQALDAR